MKNLTVTQDTAPTAYITKGKQRIKQNGETVYLKDGDEFEIEIFNPTHSKIKAEIKVNEESIGSDIVLRPGERVFLERYTSNSHKFVFSTYHVNGTNNDVINAIKLNGNVSIKFYIEYHNSITYTSPITYTYINQFNTPWNNFYCNTTGSYPSVLPSITTSSYGTLDMTTSNNKSLETGRIEKGGISSQKFKLDNSYFMSSPSWVVEWKILPFSQKLITKEDIVVYCSGCGRKKRQTENYCPTCGRKF